LLEIVSFEDGTSNVLRIGGPDTGVKRGVIEWAQRIYVVGKEEWTVPGGTVAWRDLRQRIKLQRQIKVDVENSPSTKLPLLKGWL
jgi:hypothetical protein